MQVQLTDKMVVDIYENMSNRIVKKLSQKYNKKEILIKRMIEEARLQDYNILEAEELINEFENEKK